MIELAILKGSPVGTAFTNISIVATIPKTAPTPCDIEFNSSSAKEYFGIVISSMLMPIC